jgi:1,2-diacylglycerol 3-beta-galactosyltransferase
MARPSGDTSKRADMVVSVHPLTQDIPLRILNFLDSDGKSRNEGRTTPFATVVTDLGGAHPTWFNPGVDSCFVPSDALYQCALDRKVRPEQIVQHGLPIRRGFWADQSSGTSSSSSSSGSGNFFGDLLASFGGGGKDASASGDVGATNGGEKSRIRDSLGLLQGLPTVLIVGGGDGMGGIIEQANALGDKLNSEAASSGNDDEPSFQMVVVCGKNESAEKKLSAKTWGKGVSVEVKGFVNNMDEWMRSSDVIVTKAGPGTIAEASICGLPCMLSSYL